MTFPLEDTFPAARTEASDVSIIRREFVALTGGHFSAVILNQLLYWTQRVKDFDLLLEEERHFQPDCNVSPRHGWIYKTADELNEETMLGISHPTMRKYLKLLIDQGWIDERANPVERWNKTTQYRVNLRKIQEDLSVLGRTLPHVYMKAFASSLEGCSPSRGLPKSEENASVRILHSDENSEDSFFETSLESEENSNERNLHSDVRNFGSNESCLHSNVKNFDSNERNLHSYTYTENTTENKNKDHTQDAGARENCSDLEKLKNSELGNSISDESVSEEMIRLWEYHVVQKLFPTNWRGTLHLTVTRKDQLESLFAFHFQNDIRLWEEFCLRVKSSHFLMGGGPNGWKVTLDWALLDRNLLKILEGNFDDSNRSEQQGSSHEWDLAKMEPNPVRDAEKAEIIASIKDPVWRIWCSQLAIGVRLNKLRMQVEPLSIADLKDIANARFLECEDERLVWIGSSDQSVLDKIENLRLKINWVFAKEYPKARTVRTRLLEESFSLNELSLNELPLEEKALQSSPLSTKPTQQQGDITHV